jgi:hypothetical protein
MTMFAQAELDGRCERVDLGIQQLAPVSQVVVTVDVLSCSTWVEIAVSRDAIVFPYRWEDESALHGMALRASIQVSNFLRAARSEVLKKLFVLT